MSLEVRVNALLEKRARIWEQAKALLDEAGDNPLSVDQRSTYDRLTVELEALSSEARSLVEAEERNIAAAELRTRAGNIGTPAGALTGDDDFEAEVRSFLMGEKRAIDVVPEKRTLVKGTATAGGNTIKTSFYDRLQEYLILNGALLGAGVTTIDTTSGENLEIPKVTARSTASRVLEAAAIPVSEPTFSKVTLGAYKYGVLLQISRELVEDTSVDLLGFIARQAGVAVGNGLGTDLLLGTGASMPRGLMIDTTLGVTSATGVAGAPSGDNLIDLYHAVLAPYRQNGTWVMNDSMLASIRKIKDSTGQYLWQPALVAGDPDRLLGRPVVTDPNIAAAGLNNKSIAFGDLSAYYVRRVNGFRFEQSTDYAFNTDLVTYKVVLRADGALIDTTGAVKHFVGAAS